MHISVLVAICLQCHDCAAICIYCSCWGVPIIHDYIRMCHVQGNVGLKNYYVISYEIHLDTPANCMHCKLFFPCHCSCNKHRFIVCTDIYSVLGHGGSQRHLLHSVVLHRRSWQRSLLTTSGSPGSDWAKFHISYNHSTGLRQLMQALLCVDSRHHFNWTAKSLQQEEEGGGVSSKWRWEIMEWCKCKHCVNV